MEYETKTLLDFFEAYKRVAKMNDADIAQLCETSVEEFEANKLHYAKIMFNITKIGLGSMDLWTRCNNCGHLEFSPEIIEKCEKCGTDLYDI